MGSHVLWETKGLMGCSRTSSFMGGEENTPSAQRTLGFDWNEEYVEQIDKFSIEQLYKALRGDYQKVEWRRLTYNNVACPKWIFAFYLALQSRLLTNDRLATWGCVEDVHCVLCGTDGDSHNHIFFRSLFSSQVWQKVFCWQSIHGKARGWEEETTWVIAECKGKQARAEVYRMSLAATIYLIWQERNQQIFQKITRTLTSWKIRLFKRCI
uniref:Reverse transcriptase zinc-binding domain-containing protein n=1 Tax=Solanum lycopersicum TaxID=4081 RepID=A0A3Q7EXN5_SOLLC